MAIWFVRAGRHGEHEGKFVEDSRIYLTWEELTDDLSSLSDKPKLAELLRQTYQDARRGKISNHTGQIWAFLRRMKIGEWVIVPRQRNRTLCIGEIKSDYIFDRGAPMPYRHFRKVRWVKEDVPRSKFDREILYRFNVMKTIYQIGGEDSENRVKLAVKDRIAPRVDTSSTTPVDANELPDFEDSISGDLEETARDEIAALIIRKFKGHEMEALVEAVLRAQGYITYHSPKGKDDGIDILAASGPLGFGTPKICVQVKSRDDQVDTPTLHQLIGAMQNVNAEQGLLVSWGGFKTSVERETPKQFFKVRLWNKTDLIDQILMHYDKLDEDIRAEIPLKRIWTVAKAEEDD